MTKCKKQVKLIFNNFSQNLIGLPGAFCSDELQDGKALHTEIRYSCEQMTRGSFKGADELSFRNHLSSHISFLLQISNTLGFQNDVRSLTFATTLNGSL